MEPISVKNSGYIELNKKHDGRDGNLVIAESLKDIPFEIKRVYFINNLENCISIRGKHAHKELNQVIFCVNGSFILDLDDGSKKQSILMNQDNVGVFLGKMLWHEMRDFSSGCVLLVFASDFYNESDYIRNYNDFKKYSKLV
jgi:dTDP-4-dehydrorhamnose 3,5-epimerase-like enzyme